MSDMDLLIDVHLHNQRQGPGTDACSEMALRLSGLRTTDPLKVADIGCGTGAAALALAALLPQAQITAVDFLGPFVERLTQRAADAGLAHRVRPLQAQMETLPFEDGQFDLLWSEGAIYNMGFANGVASWRRFLKPAGVLVVSELTWTTHTRPAGLQAHWEREYAEVDTAAAKLGVLERQGFAPLGFFVLPEQAWLDNYYHPLQAGFSDFLQRHRHSEAALALVLENEQEMALYQEHKAYFSYGMYVARRVD